MTTTYRVCWQNRTEGELVFHVAGTSVVGRGSENEIVIDEEGVSRRHCRFEAVDGGIRVTDVGSTNGTYVNGRRIQSEIARPGDQILVGRSLFIVRGTGSKSADLAHPGATMAVGATTIEVALRSAEAEDPDRLPSNHRVADHLRTLCRVLEIITDSTSPDDLFAKALGALTELLDVHYGAIVLGTDPSAPPAVTVGEPQTPSQTVLQRVLRDGEGILANDLAADTRMGAAASLVGKLDSRILAVPILRQGETLGAIYLLADGESSPLTEAELRLVSVVARSLALAAENLHRHAVVVAENETLRKNTAEGDIVGVSDAIQRVLEVTRRAADSDVTVLLTGETGTGKELFARAIHDWSRRVSHPFVAINCGAIPHSMVESELFGHEKGAFTGATERRIGRFEMARGGTLFLDEVGELPLDLQVKLLRVLETKRFFRVGGSREVEANIRLVAATNRDLDERVERGEFREDLLYRIRVLEIVLPPLRERREDIDLIADHLLAQLTRGMKHPPRLSEEARQGLRTYAWPGNVRELRNVLERGLILCRSDTMSLGDLIPPRSRGVVDVVEPSSDTSLRDVESRHIKAVLDSTGWNKSKAAEVLGIGRTNIYEKIKQYGLSPDD